MNAEDAGRLLGVSPDTIRLWQRKGMIPAKKSKDSRGRTVLAIPTATLTPALFKATCILCGKVFRSKRPAKSKFCSFEHRMRWHSLRKQRYPGRGRPKKGAKPRPALSFLSSFQKKSGKKR